MDGHELRHRLDRLRRAGKAEKQPYIELAPLLGLSLSGLHKQMNGQAKVSRQTEILLEQLERGCTTEPGTNTADIPGHPGERR